MKGVDDVEFQNNYVLRNIDNFISLSNTKTAREMASRIGVPENTWRSFMKNPASSSSAKTKFCLYYGLTVKQLETTLLEDEFIKECIERTRTGTGEKREIPLSEISDNDLQLLFENSYSKSVEFEDLKRKVRKKTSLSFKVNLENAKKKSIDNPSEALALMTGVFSLMGENDIKIIIQSDLKTFIDLSIDADNYSGLELLIDKLTNKEYYNYKVVSVLALLLDEADLTEYAKRCLNAVLLSDN